MACYDFDYAVQLLQQAIGFAEIEHDFVPLRKWVNEVELSGHEAQATEARLNTPAGQEFLLATITSVAAREVAPDEAIIGIRRWLSCGEVQAVKVPFVNQHQFA
jgi:hypothetical protein